MIETYFVPNTPVILPQWLADNIKQVFKSGKNSVRLWKTLYKSVKSKLPTTSENYYLYFVCPCSGKIAKTGDGKGFKFNKELTGIGKLGIFIEGLLRISVYCVAASNGLGEVACAAMSCVPFKHSNFDFERYKAIMKKCMHDSSIESVMIEVESCKNELSPKMNDMFDDNNDEELLIQDVNGSPKVNRVTTLTGNDYYSMIELLMAIAEDKSNSRESPRFLDAGNGLVLLNSGLIKVQSESDHYTCCVHPDNVEIFRREGTCALRDEVKSALKKCNRLPLSLPTPPTPGTAGIAFNASSLPPPSPTL